MRRNLKVDGIKQKKKGVRKITALIWVYVITEHFKDIDR